MRESRTFGSVGGEGGNVLAYPAYSGRAANVATKAAHDPEPMFQVGHTVGRSGARNAAVPSLAVGKRSLANALFRGVPQFDLGSRRTCRNGARRSCDRRYLSHIDLCS